MSSMCPVHLNLPDSITLVLLKLTMFVFTCGLFNDAVISSDNNIINE
jgi:hypothetical protein